jgi:hypothetical protein
MPHLASLVTFARSSEFVGRYIEYCLADGPDLGRGIAVLAIHYNRPEIRNDVMSRLHSFVLLARQNEGCANGEWSILTRAYDRFVPITHAIAWSPVNEDEPFEVKTFLKTAQQAPFVIAPSLGIRM